ncbi:hypothetical protein V5F29_21185 [Xanthobacter aminoxidans]|uniref:hypothetical protein n=1 Tax=Xanthobacter aminoxidans TaxID=186280 RepID=UPI00372C0F97
MRFPPSDGAIPVGWIDATGRAARNSLSLKEFARRLGLMHKLLIASAPRVLSTLVVLSLTVRFTSVAFSLYSVVV